LKGTIKLQAEIASRLSPSARQGKFGTSVQQTRVDPRQSAEGYQKKCERYFVFAPERASIDPQNHRQNG